MARIKTLTAFESNSLLIVGLMASAEAVASNETHIDDDQVSLIRKTFLT
jgi:hypothetical protein